MKYKPGDIVKVTYVCEDHPSGQWLTEMGFANGSFEVLTATLDDEGNGVYELDLGVMPPWGWGLFWEPQLQKVI